MRVLLISLNQEREPFTAAPLGLALVASALKGAGHEVMALDLLFSGDTDADIHAATHDFGPGLVGVSIRNIESSTEFLLPHYKGIIETIKKNTHAPILLGGPGFSIMPQPALEFLEVLYGVVGEGEQSVVEFVSVIETGLDPREIPGVCSLIGGIYTHVRRDRMDMAHAISPAWEMFPVGEYDMVGVQSKRGCSFSCIYCTYPTLEGRRIRLREPESVAVEMSSASASGARAFYFVDNVFNNPQSHAIDVCSALINQGVHVSWGCLASPLGLNAGMVELMKLAGCESVEIGADSLSDTMLKQLGKAFKLRDIESAVSACKAGGMMHMVFLILGGPGETEDTLSETFAALERIQPDKVFAVSGIRVYPRTPLAEIAVAEGAIGPDETMFEPVFYQSSALGERLYTLCDGFFNKHPDWIYYPARGVNTPKETVSINSADVSWGIDGEETLERVISCVPLLLRPIARRAVKKKAAEIAAGNGHNKIDSLDVRDAFLIETPSPFQAGMKETLRKYGLLDG